MFSYRQQYRQIDFLRLFRLCCSLGIAKRKRKMPIEYDNEDMAIASGRRLLKLFLEKHIFIGWPKVRTQYENFCVNILLEDRLAINIIASLQYHTSLLNVCGDKGREASTKYSELSVSSDFVLVRLPHEIKINVNGNTRNISSHRPSDNLYECALACMEYKRLWNENITVIRDFQSFFNRERVSLEAEQRKRDEEIERIRIEKLERINREREVQAAQQRIIQEEGRVAFAAQVATQAERSRRSAQERFNQALSRFRSARDGGGET